MVDHSYYIHTSGTLNYASEGRYSLGRKNKNKNVTHEPMNPATLYYDCSTKGRCVQKAKNCKTREPHIATDPLAHPPTDRPNDQPSRTSLPTHDVLQQYSSTSSYAALNRRVSRLQGPWIGFKIYTPYRLFARRDAPRSPRWSSAPVLSPANCRAAVWEGRGATARPREAKWSSGVAVVCGVYFNQSCFKDPFGHHYYHY